jgi:transcriptional regulator with XRE-family HTH domain
VNTEKTGEFIAELRKEKQLTQSQLATAIHVSDKAISRWETGRGLPDIDNLEALSDYLDVSIAELIRGEKISEPVSREELQSITSAELSLTKVFLEKRKYISILLGFVLGSIIILTAFIHMMSPIYVKDPGEALTIEKLSDGSIVGVLDEKVSGYDLERYKDPDSGLQLVFIGCYRTKWDQLTGKNSDMLVRIGNKDSVDAVYYYPNEGEDIHIYGNSGTAENGGVLTLPRLVYNYWLIIGIFLSAAGLIAYAFCRKKYYADRILKIALVPVAFTISIPLCLFGRFDEVYNATYYLTGILLLTAAFYLVFRIVMLVKKGNVKNI